MSQTGDSDGWVPYGTRPRRRGLWQRFLDRLNQGHVQYNYDGFAGMDRAEAAAAALQAVDIPATVTLTDSGPVLIVGSHDRGQAEALIAPFQAER